MLYYNRIDVFEGIHVNETSVSKQCDIGHYWYFLNKGTLKIPYLYSSFKHSKCWLLLYY